MFKMKTDDGLIENDEYLTACNENINDKLDKSYFSIINNKSNNNH